MYVVYVAKSLSSGKIYIGQTENVLKRELQHNKQLPFRKKSYTYKQKGPWKIVYTEQFYTRKESVERERQLKTSRGRAYIKDLLLKVP